MPYGKGTYGSKVGRPKKKKGRKQAGKNMSKPRNTNTTSVSKPSGAVSGSVPGARSKKKTVTKKPAKGKRRRTGGSY